ncbi:MAG: hypothetical protein ACR652_10930 [Methylocystis sp.]|uniref:hypothetical protein n=1 Tax=Methylocystis sp. TaxID=1911079 RepID=UPI003DA296FD
MAEPLGTHEIIDRLHDLVNEAQGIEMAVSGSVSISKEERAALDRLAATLSDGLRCLYRELSAQHEAAEASNG